ncbi:hypothetical protein [uncultured Tessaracoccus sp.]|uniref:hypothetical protein n=1 Tax=uncultured Tessaracoccus sp. TaxID=905023 RepID=UPI00261AC069|nr:hypothetical protein [uncultured Tessaracoccus sp.]
MMSSLIWGAVLIVVLFVLLSPLESLNWWADRGEREIAHTMEQLALEPSSETSSEHYLVYLSGVGTLGGELSRREQAWLDELARRMPGVRIVDDVFPYAVNNQGLLQRTTAWLWGTLDKLRRGRFPLMLPMLINLRNVAQVLVSADPRYGPTFNIGLAQEIWRSLQRKGYVRGSGVPVTLIGFSGGAQMALGAGWFLDRFDIPVNLISIGGIFGDDPGLDKMQHVWHLTGTGDRLHYIGNVAFPGRWVTAPLSPYGRIRRSDRFEHRTIGPMEHAGAKGYLGRREHGPDGRSYAQITTDEICGIIQADKV